MQVKKDKKIVNIVFCVVGMLIGTAIAYAFGTMWFCYSTGTGLGAAMALCVIPFIPGDLIKIAIAAVVGRYGDDQHFDGVFYRNADFYAYTDMENAEFYEDEYSTFYIWYYDGVNRYLLGNDYTIGEDGLAYHDEDGLIYPAGWIPEEPYDPAVDWGANWMDSWDI